MKKILGRLKNLDEWIIAGLVGLIAVDLMIQVFCRFVLNRPLIWSEEVARYLFVWAAMIGLGYSVRVGQDISMSMFVRLLPKLAQAIIQVVTDLFVIVIYIIVLPSAVSYTAQQHQILTPATEVPKSFLTVSVPIGFVLLIIQLAARIVRTVRDYRKGGGADAAVSD